MGSITKGDFSALAQDYTRYRPSYNRLVIDLIYGATRRPPSTLDVADVGAGTGIFTRLLSERAPRSLAAVEPNDNMRAAGEAFLPQGVRWIGAPAERTTLESASIDLLSMASSFHWPDTAQALAEFNRVLRPGGVFVAAWNPRITERSATEHEIAGLLQDKYALGKRVSSGRSGITERLTGILGDSGYFAQVSYSEAMDVVHLTPDHYVGAWRSVNDIRSQLGEENFARFIDDVVDITAKVKAVEVHYLTRAWIARKPDHPSARP